MKRFFGIAVLLFAFLTFSCENSFFGYAAKIFKVKFSTNGGTSIDEVYTNEISESPYTQKADCDLEGWYLKSNFSGEPIEFPFKVSAETTLYAKWLQKYNVTFSVNGGSEIPTQLTSKLETEPLSFKEDYELEGWYENADFSGGKVSFPYTLTKATILYAKWTRTYNASFETNGGLEISAYKASKISETPETTKEGFSFAGWYLKSDFSGEPVEFPYTMTSDTAFYAKWLQMFTVSFESNGGSEVESVFDTKIENEPKPIKNDFDFVGWYEASDFSGTLVRFPYNLTADTTLYAKWGERYTVTFTTDGGSSIATLKTARIENAPETTKTGNTLDGWYLDSALTQKAEFPLILENDTTLYAKWIPAKYTISYDANGATSGAVPDSEQVEHGSSYTIADNTGNLEKTGSEFVNWNTKADGSGKSYVAGMQIEVTENLTLYARWMTEAELSGGGWNYPTSTPEITWAGNGTEESPYIIRNAQQLADLAYMVNYGTSYSGKYFTLKNDIDLNKDITVTADSKNAKEWHPIGNSASYYFAGNFDGAGHTINGLYINSANYIYAGLFGYVSGGKVKNVVLGQGYIFNKFSTAESYTGSIVGCLVNGGTIDFCGNEMTIIIDADSNKESYVGGIVGYANGTTGKDIYDNSINVLSEIRNSYNKNTVKGSTSYNKGNIGGIVGKTDKNTRICNCFNKGEVQGYYVGGIIGYSMELNYIYNSYNTGKVIGYYVGGIWGYSFGGNSYYASNTMENCYNLGIIDSSASYKGGLVGYIGNYYMTISYCYYYSETANSCYGRYYDYFDAAKGSFSSEISSVSYGYVSGGTVYQCLNAYVNGNNSSGLLCNWKEIDGWPALEWEK